MNAAKKRQRGSLIGTKERPEARKKTGKARETQGGNFHPESITICKHSRLGVEVEAP